jgi:hypothetical protein
MALVGDTLVDTAHFSQHPCILTTYLVLRLKSGFLFIFWQNCFGEMANFTGNLKHYILGGKGGRGVSYGVKFRDTRKHWNNPKIIAV